MTSTPVSFYLLFSVVQNDIEILLTKYSMPLHLKSICCEGFSKKYLYIVETMNFNAFSHSLLYVQKKRCYNADVR